MFARLPLELFLQKLFRTPSLGTHTELQRGGWNKEGGDGLSTFSVCFSHNLCEDPGTHELQEKSPRGCTPGSLAGQAHKPAVSWLLQGKVGADAASYMVWTAGRHALGPPELSPVALSSRATLEASGQPQVK